LGLLLLTWVSTTTHISTTATAKPTFMTKSIVMMMTWSPASREATK
jgi:hypothetical protein